MNKLQIERDFRAFSDNETDVVLDPSSGEVMYYKNGSEQICKLITEGGNDVVEFQGTRISYRTFIAKHLAKLDLFAQKIMEKRQVSSTYVDSEAVIIRSKGQSVGTGLELMKNECDSFLEFGTKVNFVTADAGLGKSMLFKQFQYQQAQRYSLNDTSYLFWHVDLQGRNLVRLAEAIMYDLGELRLPGLYYPSILNLIQKRMIILGIDGFDELAAEIGGPNALSSLSNLVKEMEGEGTLFAASRRTFFDTHDYLQRTSMMKTQNFEDIIFNEIKLQEWSKNEATEYLKKCNFPDPEKTFNCIALELHDSKHPILTRPFLFAKLVSVLDIEKSDLSEIFSGANPQEVGVAVIVEAFIKREVNKWKERDTITGNPYLSFDQHIEFLSVVAKEMWDTKKDFVTLEEIELFISMLMVDWKIEEAFHPIIVRMIKSHAFLVPVTDSKYSIRRFDHEEFRNYFLARSFANLLENNVKDGNIEVLTKFLYLDQLPDSVAMYCFRYIDLSTREKVETVLNSFKQIIEKEWKPTYVQQNVGTLLPFLLDRIHSDRTLLVDSKVTYSSIIFENKELRNIIFKNGNFVNISFRQTIFDKVSFFNCSFNEIRIEEDSSNSFTDVFFKDCEVISLSITRDGEVKESAYSPNRIREILKSFNIDLTDSSTELTGNIIESVFMQSDLRKALNKFLLRFNKMIIQYEKNITEERYLGNDTDLILSEVIPLLEKYEVIELVDTKKARQAGSKAWRLKTKLDDFFKFDGTNQKHPYSELWNHINSPK